MVLVYRDSRAFRSETDISKIREPNLAISKSRTTKAEFKPRELSETEMRLLGLEPQERAFMQVISDESVDRYQDIVRQDGLEFASYADNPVVLWHHNRKGFEGTDNPPIGQTLKLWTESKSLDSNFVKRSMSVLRFHDETALADEIYRLYRAGILRTNSIGFSPSQVELRRSDDDKEVIGLEFIKSDLREDSIVNIPANIGAFAKMSIEEGSLLELGTFPEYKREVESWLDTHSIGEGWEPLPGHNPVRVDDSVRNAFEDIHRGLRKKPVVVDHRGNGLETEAAPAEMLVELKRTLEQLGSLIEKMSGAPPVEDSSGGPEENSKSDTTIYELKIV